MPSRKTAKARWEGGRYEATNAEEFLIYLRLTADDTGSVHGGYHMRCVSVAPNHIVVMEDTQEAVQPDLQSCFLPDLPQRRLLIGLVHFQETADQAPFAVVCPTLKEYP